MSSPAIYDPHAFYQSHSQISHPGIYSEQYKDLPSDIPGLVKLIQGFLIHIYHAEAQGVSLYRKRTNEVLLRTVPEKLKRLFEMDERPLMVARAPKNKLVGNCRDFALFLCSLIRHQQVPARIRCGFADYLMPGKLEPHWICEYWQSLEKRWVGVDAQLDRYQVELFKIDFDPCDLPENRYVIPGKIWLSKNSKTDKAQIPKPMQLLTFGLTKNSLIRDFLALNRVELLPQDKFQLMNKKMAQLNSADKTLLAKLATISTGSDRDFLMLRAAFITHQQELLPRYFL